jgi:hypothetical protein
MPMNGPGQTVSLPAPTGGLNSRDPLDSMPADNAFLLDNFFPETSTVRLREGYVEFCDTGQADPVQTLFSYSGAGSDQMLAAVSGNIYDVSTSTPSAALGTGFATDVWSWSNFASGGGAFLLMANDSGADIPQVYDGATLTDTALTGVTDTELSQVVLHAQRVFYVQRNTLSVWYTTAGAYQGALTQFDFGPLCRKGGTINAIGSWTRDNGSGGADDLFVVVTTQGEVLLYSGIDPATAGDWVLKGIFTTGLPVRGPRCLMNTGPDMVLFCADGFQPLSDYLQYGETRAGQTDLARNIGNAAQESVANERNEPGWQGILYSDGSAMIVNIPQGSGTFYQYVANTTTGAWCRFKGWDAYCWGRLQADVYFGGDAGIVYHAFNGVSDNGIDIVGEMVTSYQYVGGRGVNKRFTLCRPVLQTNGQLQYSLNVNVDYASPAPLATVNSNPATGSLWDSGLWDDALWGEDSLSLQRVWSGVSGLGYAVAVHMKVSTHTLSVNVNSFDLMYEQGWSI